MDCKDAVEPGAGLLAAGDNDVILAIVNMVKSMRFRFISLSSFNLTDQDQPAYIQKMNAIKNISIFPLDIHFVSMYRASMIRKELVAASAEPLILSLLSKGESYGYAIIQEVKARSGGKLQWTDGMLYPVLHRMERRGLLKSRWGESETGRKRKYYSIKKDGKTAMVKHHEQWSLIHSVLAGLKNEQYV